MRDAWIMRGAILTILGLGVGAGLLVDFMGGRGGPDLAAQAARSDSIADASLASADSLRGVLVADSVVSGLERLRYTTDSTKWAKSTDSLALVQQAADSAATVAAADVLATADSATAVAFGVYRAQRDTELAAEKAAHEVTRTDRDRLSALLLTTRTTVRNQSREIGRLRDAEEGRKAAMETYRAEAARQGRRAKVATGVAIAAAAVAAIR